MQKLITLSLIVLLILSSCKLKDTTTPTTPVDPGTGDVTIKVVLPNGTESWSEGKLYQIQWTSTGTPLVRIQYSFDNGSSWSLVVDSLRNTGTYDWQVPNTISNQCRLRVSSIDGVSADESDNVFAIVRNSNESLRIISPIGNEIWNAGTKKQIKWYSAGIDSVRIDYTTNNGQLWNLIAIDKLNTGVYDWNPVPNNASALAKVRIKDAKDGNPSTESTDPFTILPQPKITVVAPNGNETWTAGSSEIIKWTSTSVENVKIEYTTNNGATWVLIAANAPSTGTYNWNVIPNISSLQCKIRISDSAAGIASDSSDDNFTIAYPGAQLILVKSPNGGEKWIAGSSQIITWDAAGITNVKIEYTLTNGVSWNTIIASTPSTGSYTWSQLPNTISTNCRIRISDASDGLPYDDSDQFFSIEQAPDIKVLSPNGGETIQSGTNYEIRWTSENVANVRIEYTINGGADWISIINSTPSFGSYVWTNVPSVNSLQCRIRVSDVQNGTPFDISDQNFQITNLVVRSIKVMSPNGGEDWEAGTQQNITWNSSGVAKVKIELSTNKGSDWSVLIDSLAGGAYQWTIGETLNSTQCQIRISDARDNTVSDISDATFIISPRKYIFVTKPVGPVVYKDSDAIEITWESSGIKYVGIKYTWTNGVAQLPDIPAYTVLVDKIPNTGKFVTSFSIPADNQYHVIVYNADEGANNTPSARNIGNFSIIKTAAPSIIVLAPNGNEQWLVSSQNALPTDVDHYHPYEIRWNATNLNKVKIEWSTTAGGSWYVVPGADSTTNDGIFVWAPGRLDAVRPDSSDNCRIRISSADASVSASDQTDGFFSIHESKKIRVEFPNTGEDFYPPISMPPTSDIHWPMALRWTSYAVTSVDIYYSLDNVTWSTLVTDYQSTGLYPWDFVWGTLYNFFGPIEPTTSSQGRIKIVEHGGQIYDVNDVPFWLNVKKEN